VKLSFAFDDDNFAQLVADSLPNIEEVKTKYARHLSTVTMPALMQAQFASRSGPDGVTWKPAKDGHLPQMERTGKLRAGYKFSARHNKDGIVVSCTNLQAYWWYLQEGTPTIEPRKQFPDDGDIPYEWQQTLFDDFTMIVKQEMAKRRPRRSGKRKEVP